MEEEEGFEPPQALTPLSVFKTDPFNQTWVFLHVQHLIIYNIYRYLSIFSRFFKNELRHQSCMLLMSEFMSLRTIHDQFPYVSIYMPARCGRKTFGITTDSSSC